jgi:hypothetical protein
MTTLSAGRFLASFRCEMKQSFSRILRQGVIAVALVGLFGSVVSAQTPKPIPYITSNIASGLGNQPYGVAVDSTGNVYFGAATSEPGYASAVVYKVDAVTGIQTVFAGGLAKATSPASTCASPVAGIPGSGDNVGDGCIATQTYLGGVRGLATWIDTSVTPNVEYLYIPDSSGNYIHRVNLKTNIMEWVVGNGSSTYTGDGANTTAIGIKNPYGIAIDKFGDLFWGDGGSTGKQVRMLRVSDNTVHTIVGCTSGGSCSTYPTNPATCTTLTATGSLNIIANLAYGLTFDADGNLYYVDKGCYSIRKIAPNASGVVDGTGAYSTFVGDGGNATTDPGSWYDTSGNTTKTYGGAVRSIYAIPGTNDLYYATTSSIMFYDSTTKWAHKIGSGGTAGCPANMTAPYAGCPAPNATFSGSSGGIQLVSDKYGNLYVADYGNYRIPKIAIGTDFAGSAATFVASGPVQQTVMVHGASPLPAITADQLYFGASVGACTTYATGDLGQDCPVTLTYDPSRTGMQTGNLTVGATKMALDAIGNRVAVRLGDFNGDHRADLTWHNDADGHTLVWQTNDLSISGYLSELTISDLNWRIAANLDVNGDGKSDILWHNTSTGATYLWITNGGWFDSYGLETIADTNWQIVGTGDFDGDHKSDILWRNLQTGDNTIWFMNGGAINSTNGMQGVADLNWKIAAVADFNGDTKADILWRNSVTGSVLVWFMDGSTLVTTGSPGIVSDPTWQIAAVADFEGDGRNEILWRNSVSGANYMWFLNNDGSFANGAPVEGVSDLNWQLAATGDIDGDGKADLVWRNFSTGANYVWFMNGSTLVSSGPLEPVPASTWQIY